MILGEPVPTTTDVAQRGPGRGTAPTVLLVEDDHGLGVLVSGLLDEAGYRPVTIADHEQIGSAVDRLQPRCVIIDGALAPMGQGRSWSDAIAIRRAHPDLPLVMFTADVAALAEARAGTSGRSRAAGFAGVVGKPFLVEEFLATVRSAVAAPHPAVVPSAAAPEERRLATTRSNAVASRPAEDPAAVAWISAVVHELRTLTVINGQLQLARRRDMRDRPDRLTVALDRALVQVARMDRLISEMLDRSGMDAGALRLDVVAFDLCAIVADVIAQYELDDPQQIAFESATPDVRVRGDPFRVAQIVGNLVNNALKYGLTGSPIDVSLHVVGSEAQLWVKDHGMGVPANEQGRLFEPYYRSTRTHTVPGTGLGLHISRRLAELHGGRLWLERSTEAGSVFALALPIADS
ncbi:MAG: ATP-binding response regulator [Candidatus Limnocylindria bacterium]